MVSSPVPVSVPTSPGPTRPIVINTIIPSIPYAPQFWLPTVKMDYPYGMTTSIMTRLQTQAFTYRHNTMTTFSPYSPQVASGSALSNPSRTI